MIRIARNMFGRLIHTCTEFASYTMNLQRSRCKVDPDCRGGPTVDDARRDYRASADFTAYAWTRYGSG